MTHNIGFAVKRWALALLVAGCTFAAASVAHAQNPGNVQRFTGVLDESCQTLRDGSFFRIYEIQVQAGMHYDFLLTSPDFNAFMWIQPDGRPINVAEAFDKDGPRRDAKSKGTFARFNGSPDRSGSMLVIVNSLRGGERGAYELRITTTPRQSPVAPPDKIDNVPPSNPPANPPGADRTPGQDEKQAEVSRLRMRDAELGRELRALEQVERNIRAEIGRTTESRLRLQLHGLLSENTRRQSQIANERLQIVLRIQQLR